VSNQQRIEEQKRLAYEEKERLMEERRLQLEEQRIADSKEAGRRAKHKQQSIYVSTTFLSRHFNALLLATTQA
jgi:hypothetical protein